MSEIGDKFVDRVRNVLSYDSESGDLKWIVRLSARAPVGSRAGTYSHGYRAVSVDGTVYRATTLIWLIMFGRKPKHFIDHKDGDRANDRLSNLREATPTENARNVRPHFDNKSGLKGVSLHSRDDRTRRWVARIRFNGHYKNLGYFATKEEAHTAYSAAANEYFGEFARVA